MTNLPHFRAHMEQTHETLHEVNKIAGKAKSLATRAQAMRITAVVDRAFSAAVDSFNRTRKFNRKEAAE